MSAQVFPENVAQIGKIATKSANVARALQCIAKRYEFDSTTIQLTKSKQNTQQITRRHK
ncbi:hypothetical protein HMPREF1579_01092 [Gardnerella vaginalis JCP8066]|nr:hypothetical protein HMPREF1586_00984 [Gardnerella vaginalis JCP8522]EPI58822.1 hypothetical protein HMPREF1579_01092 [Gardnerella vaginalis JCP8066]